MTPDPEPLTTFPTTIAADDRARTRMAVIFARDHPKLEGYAIAPVSNASPVYYKIKTGKAALSTMEACCPKAGAGIPALHVALCYEPREDLAYRVAVQSIGQHASSPIEIRPVDLKTLIDRGWYTRPTDRGSDGILRDVLSKHPMATEHAVARFFVPALYGFKGWVLSADCDILVRADLSELFALADPQYAVMVVKHDDYKGRDTTKMDGQVQSRYDRKLWSSVCMWQCSHPAHLVLRPGQFGILNRWPGRDLHGFKWLKDDEIGELPHTFNHLVGIDPPNPDAKIVHYTKGLPSMAGYESCEFSDEWRAIAEERAA